MGTRTKRRGKRRHTRGKPRLHPSRIPMNIADTHAGGHRSFDILHVATATLAKAKLFLTFDNNQRKLAAAAGLTVGP